MAATNLTQAEQQVLCYTLKERIGDGGYGEVWTAEAPGGLAKAIKFIYGFHDESRAQRELKSLNHIKELRHPFLLSLERIDIVDDRLVIVTELADSSLSDRFDECIREGLLGIPRSELLIYLREAADALDYISRSHSLQHLDIKPENVLLVSGHVKVADFGLVKDINDCTQSVMGGLTPAFAAPELFDGRPSGSSDQYSLAIVFQEMLTGQRPFDGTTPAQLAAQHIHGRPNLKPLPRADQGIVGRALSKTPEHRFESCVEFVEALATGETGTASVPRRTQRPAPPRSPRPPRDVTLVMGNLPTTCRAEGPVMLPPIEFDANAQQLHPTLMIGIGELGTQVVLETKERIARDFGSAENLPAFRFLAIDVDAESLYAASRHGDIANLAEAEMIHIPLRPPEQYRSVDPSKLSWLSRRWIYNIPRSQETEGIRPLGRLALVDNCEKVQQQLTEVLKTLLDETALSNTASQLGATPQAHPRVYLIGSISGGTASGAILDIAYTIRMLLADLQCTEFALAGLLLYRAGASGSQRGISASNTYACLRELVHFRKHGFPGDDISGIPAFAADQPPFDETYFLHLGNDTRDGAVTQSIKQIAEYLYLDLATSCRGVQAKVREADGESCDKIRTFGMSMVEISALSSADTIETVIHDRLVKHWLTGEDKKFSGRIAAERLQTSLQLTVTAMFGHAVQQVSELNGLHPYDFGSTVVQEYFRRHAKNAQPLLPGSVEIVDAIRAWFDSADGHLGGRSMAERANRQLAKLAAGLGQKLTELVRLLLNEPGPRVTRADAVVNEFSQLVETLKSDIMQMYQDLQAQIEACQQQWSTTAADGDVNYDQLQRFAGLVVQKELAVLAQNLADSLHDEVRAISRQLAGVASSLRQLLVAIKPRGHFGDEEEEGHQFANTMVGEVLSHTPQIVAQVDQTIQHGIASMSGCFWKLVNPEDNRDLKTLTRAIGEVTRNAVRAQVARIDFDEVIRSARRDEAELGEWLRTYVDQARPAIMECGGEARVMLAVPCSSSGESCARAVEAIFEQRPTVISATRGEIDIFFEVQKIPITNIALHIIEDVPEAATCVGRLQSRNDVDWEPLTGIA